MNFTYLLLANFYLLCWIAFYQMVYSRKTTFFSNRRMLLFGIFIAFVLPFLSFQWIWNVLSPSATVMASAGTGFIIVPVSSHVPAAISFPFWTVLLWTYWSGVAVMTIVLGWKLTKLYLLLHQYPRHKYPDHIHVVTPANWEVFSFLHFLFAPEGISESIYEHELVHIRQKHTLDILLIELVKMFCWFNPAIYLYQNALKMTHEYLADSKTVEKTNHSEYAQKLVNQSFHLSELSLINPFFNHSQLYKRLRMLHKKEKSGKSIWSYLLLLPVLAGIILFTSSFSLKNKLSNAIQNIKPVELNEKAASQTEIMKTKVDTTIQGFIKSAKGKPLSNVTIYAPNSSKSAVTNQKGHFELKDIPYNAIIQIFKAGYNTITLKTSNRTQLNIVLYPRPVLPNKLNVTGHSNKPLPPPPPTPSAKSSMKKNGVFMSVEQMPEFPGGKTALMKYLHDNIRYPSAARENGIKGTVVVQFIVNKDGTLQNIKTIGKKKGGGLEEEAIRVVKNMPKWKPGKQNGENVRVEYSLPIRFMLQ